MGTQSRDKGGAELYCSVCDMYFCVRCGAFRHRHGSLRHHKISFARTGEYQPPPADRCSACESLSDSPTVTCMHCDLAFCADCDEEFHAYGATKEHHRVPFSKKPIKPSAVATPTRLTNHSQMIVNPAKLESLSEGTVRTVKVVAMGVGIRPDELVQSGRKHSGASYHLSIDCPNRLVTVYDKRRVKTTDDMDRFRISRSFATVKGATVGSTDAKHFMISFNDTSGAWEFYADEITVCNHMVQLINQLTTLTNCDFSMRVPNQVEFACYALKKGKFKWSSRWMVLRNNAVEVHRNRTAFVDNLDPINRISLGFKCEIEVLGRRTVVIKEGRAYTFKFHTEGVRNSLATVAQLLARQVSTGGGTSRTPLTPVLSGNRSVFIPDDDDDNDNEEESGDEDSESRGRDSDLDDPDSPVPGALRRATSRNSVGSHDSNRKVPRDESLVPSSLSRSLSMGTSLHSSGGSGAHKGVLVRQSSNLKTFPGAASQVTSLSIISRRKSVSGDVDRHERTQAFQDELTNCPRIQTLEDASLPTNLDLLMSRMDGKINTKIQFYEETPDMKTGKEQQYLTPPPEANVVERVFWLMRRFGSSMEYGAYVTPKLWVSKQIWKQQGIKFVAYDAKVENFSNLLEILSNITQFDINKPDFCSRVMEAVGAVNQVQNNLAQGLSYIHSVKSDDKKKHLFKSFKKWTKRATAKGQKVSDTVDYFRPLKDIFNRTGVIEQWLKELESSSKHPQEASVLRLVVDSLQFVCTIVLQDVKLCLHRYVRHTTKRLTDT